MTTVLDDSMVLNEPEPEREPNRYSIPKHSVLTGIAEGPPRYRDLFPNGYTPISTDVDLYPPPSYEETETFTLL